jgi:hypothetical protein
MADANTTPPLERDALIAEAMRRSGLDDIGDTWFFEPLDKMLECLKAEAQFTERGAAMEAEKNVGYLVNRLTRISLLKKHPEILDEDVQVAAAILSLGRTGSTKTHRLLGSAPSHTFMKWWEGQFPYPLEGEEIGNPVERLRLATELKAKWPDMSHIRSTELDSAEEEAFVIDQAFVGTMIECFVWSPTWTEWLKGYDQMPAYEELKVALQMLQWQDKSRRGKFWILKSPTHMSAPATLLDAFPGALIVQTHRHPLKTVPSHCSMITPLIKMKSDAITTEQIGAFTCKRWADMSNDVIDLRDRIGDDRFIDIQYEDLTGDAMGEMQKVYDRMGRKMTEADRAAMEQHLIDNVRTKWAPHIYDYETYGLSEEMITRDFARYIERHCS